jgi:hypothetical protein
MVENDDQRGFHVKMSLRFLLVTLKTLKVTVRDALRLEVILPVKICVALSCTA